jgi:mono/diheme cytochrome c family protein
MRRFCRLGALLVVGLILRDASLSRCGPFAVALADEPAVAGETNVGLDQDDAHGATDTQSAGDQPVALEMPAVKALLTTHCADCHGGGADEGGFRIEKLEDVRSLVSDFEDWQIVRRRIHDMEMPPASSEPIPDTDRDALIQWIDQAIRQAACDPSIPRGPAPLRRLTRNEYRNTIRDLLGIHFDASHVLPSEGSGGEGFDNAAEVLLISPLHAEKYLDAAKMALEHAERDERAREHLIAGRRDRGRGRRGGSRDPAAVPEQPGEAEVDDEVRAHRVLLRFAERAYRRPVADEEVAPLVELYKAARQDNATFESACFYAMQGVLISPHFLFRVESPNESEVPVPLTDHELAVRLSYFLWETMPDEPLRRAADAGELSDPEKLRAQVLRMLGDSRLLDASLSFTGQWLGTAELGRTIFPDPELYPWIDDPTRAAMRDQPGYVFAEILRTDASLLELIDARWTFLTTELVRLYKIPRKELEGEIRQHLVRVELPEGSIHGSLLTMSGVMAVASYPKRTSPVLRGVWVLDNLLGSPPPPPPPDIPALDEAKVESGALSMREQFAAHRANPTCATCHDRLDPIGFALENLDMVGRWRDNDAAGPIDASAQLPDGKKIDGVQGLKQHLLEQRDVFVEQLARKLLGYALGRGLVAADLCALDTIVQRVREADYHAHALVLAIVESEPFRTKPRSQL